MDVPLRYLPLSIIYSVPSDKIIQRTYWAFFEHLHAVNYVMLIKSGYMRLIIVQSGESVRFRIQRAWFEPCSRTFCCVLEQDTSISQSFSMLPLNLMLGGNPAMISGEGEVVRGGVEVLLVVHATETGLGFRLMGHLARIQT